MTDYFQRLGDDVGRAWARAGFDAAALPEIAAEALLASPAPDHTSTTAVLDWVARCPDSRFVRQEDLVPTFAEPPVTVYDGRRFRIDVNLWATATTAIHQHAFSGAFQVLGGSSLQTRYRFEPTRRVNAHLAIGDLTLTDMRRLVPGDVCPIPSGPAFIHGLFHLEHPSATVVVRSNGDSESMPQLGYDPPGVASDYLAPSLAFSQLERRRLQTLGFAQRCDLPELEARIATVLADSGPLFAYHLVTQVLTPGLRRRGTPLPVMEAAVERWLGRVSWPDAALADTLREATIQQIIRQDLTARREVLTAPEDRLMAAVLLHAADRGAVERFLTDHDPRVSPRDQILAFIDRVGAVRYPSDPSMTALGMHVKAVAILRRIIAESLTFEGLIPRLAELHPDANLEAERAALKVLDHQLRTRSWFTAWFRTAPGSPTDQNGGTA